MIQILPGMFGLSVIKGQTGFFVSLGQAIIDHRRRSRVDGHRVPTHAFLVVDGGMVVEAEPNGAQLSSVLGYVGKPGVYWSDKPVQDALKHYQETILAEHLMPVEDLERLLRAEIAEVGRGLVGTPYNFLDYLALALAHFGIKPKWLVRYIGSTKRLICSQLVDEVYRRVDIHLFNDGRIAADVTPGDLDDYRLGLA